MKYPLFLMFFSGFAFAGEPCRYSAVLALPATLNSTSLSQVPAEVTIRWVCDEPLLVRVWGKGNSIGRKIGGDARNDMPRIFTESGEEVKCWVPLAYYAPYDAVRKLVGDQELKIRLSFLGNAEFKAAGRYYAVLDFHAEQEDGKLVRVETEKCWFTFRAEEKK